MFREPRKEATLVAFVASFPRKEGRKDMKGEELGDRHQRWRQMGRGASGETPGKAAGRMALVFRGSSSFASMLRGPPCPKNAPKSQHSWAPDTPSTCILPWT